MIELKLATWDHYPDLLEMAEKFHQASPYNGLEEYDESRVAEVIIDILNNPKEKVIIVLEDTEAGKAVGMIIAVTTQGIFSRGKTAAELAWWVNPEHRTKHSLELFQAFLYWAETVQQCSGVQMALLEDDKIDRLAKVYKRKGLTQTERAFYRKF